MAHEKHEGKYMLHHWTDYQCQGKATNKFQLV
jgi:hypothetical protein